MTIPNRVFYAVLISLWAAGTLLVAVHVYLRIYVVSANAFDPMRETAA